MNFNPEDQKAVNEDFKKCHDVAMKISSNHPNLKQIWVGTVSERLERGVDYLLNKVDEQDQELRENVDVLNVWRGRTYRAEEKLREILSPEEFSNFIKGIK